MAAATYTPTVGSDLDKIWRKIQTGVYQGTKFMSEEWEQMDELKTFDVNWSSREILVPLDINKGYGIASIAEGGKEARPSSPNASELTLTWILLNGRFTVSNTSHYIQQKTPAAMVEKQMKYQAAKKVQAFGEAYSDMFYGYTTAYLARTSTDATQANGVYTIDQGYDGTVTDGTFICSKFKVGEYVALIRSADIVANAIGVITAVTPGTPSITVTWAGSVNSDASDYIVKANSLENTTVAGTDYSRGLVGLLDILKTASVHGLSSSSIADWSAGFSDTTGGRLTGTRLRKACQDIKNAGGGKVDRCYIAQGVLRDMESNSLAAVRYSDTSGMQIDGSVKMSNIKWHDTERVPPGYAIPVVSKSLRKMTLLPKPDSGQQIWADGDKIQDVSGRVFSMDFPVANVCLNRGNTGYFSGLTEV